MAASEVRWVVLSAGVLLLAVGIAIRLGLWKSWYWKKAVMIHGYIPLGVMLILYAFNDTAQDQLGTNIILYQGTTLLIFLIGIWWSFRPPHFIIPDWVHWVETHPKKIINAMFQAVQEGKEWKSKVVSADSVDSWARQIKSRLPKK